MYRYNIYIAFVFLCILCLFSFTTEANPNFLLHSCGNTTFYNPNSTYEANLNTLLSSLSSNATNDSGFYNTTAGRNPPNIAYGLSLCRGDVTPADCQQCVADASTRIIQTSCPGDKTAFIWYDECMLRFSNQSFFSVLTGSPGVVMSNTQNVTDPARFMELLGNQMNGLASRASVTDRFGKKFETSEANFSRFQTLYSLAQCTPDLSESDCNRCLRVAINQLPSEKLGGRLLYPSCTVRFEMYEFYRIITTAPPPAAATPLPPPPHSDVPSPRDNWRSKSRTAIIIIVPTVISLVLLSFVCTFLLKRKTVKNVGEAEDAILTEESLRFDFATIRVATNDFSEANKLGQGGFGSVYKGTLLDGQEIAVKRLGRCSAQGEIEFKNEIVLMARLQHKNLVRLLGFCFQGDERILIYEFLSNTSLDRFIFDPIKKLLLDWETRYKIIVRTAKGILYLHEDSQIRIIHRDLKAANVLLDGDMNPKISDFGMARLFPIDQSQDFTNRIVGTYGYMPPEYAKFGKVSVKTDVFSFGVLLLEIVSAKKNCYSKEPDHVEHFVNHAWKNWQEGTYSNLIDPTISRGSRSEQIRCIQIGLLCVQENVSKRPTMASVVTMLSSSSISLPLPSKPGFLIHSSTMNPQMALVDCLSSGTQESDHFTNQPVNLSINEASTSEFCLDNTFKFYYPYTDAMVS